MSAVNFNMRLDTELKEQVTPILDDYGLTMPQAFKLFLNQIVKTKTIPLSFDYAKDDYDDWEYDKIKESLDAYEANPTQLTPMKTVHATAMQQARKLVASRKDGV